MRLAATFVLLALIPACAARQDNRSAAEISCSQQAERLVLERNRSQNVRLDAMGTGARTIMEETNTTAGWSRDAEFTERQRLTRECLRRVDEEAALRRQQQGGTAPAAAPSATPPAATGPLRQ
jgi:hypothetical protein